MPSLEDAKNGIQYLKEITTDELKFIDEVVADPYSHSREEIVSRLGVIAAILRSQEALNDLLVNQLLDFDKMIGVMVGRLEHQSGLHVPAVKEEKLSRQQIIQVGQLHTRLGRVPTPEEVSELIHGKAGTEPCS